MANSASLVADCGDAANARTASGAKSCIPVEGRVAFGNGSRGNVSGDDRGGLADCDAIGGCCSIADGGGGASTDLADGGRGGD